jgi:hypothetical protein
MTCVTVCSEDRRARVEGPSEGRVLERDATVRASVECRRFVAHANDVPLLGALRTSAVIGARRSREDTRERTRTDRGPRSDDAPRRAPPSGRPGCLSPSRHAREVISVGEIALSALAPASRSRRPHFVPRLGTVLLSGIARHGCGHPLLSVRFESADTFWTRWNCRAWN